MRVRSVGEKLWVERAACGFSFIWSSVRFTLHTWKVDLHLAWYIYMMMMPPDDYCCKSCDVRVCRAPIFPISMHFAGGSFDEQYDLSLACPCTRRQFVRQRAQLGMSHHFPLHKGFIVIIAVVKLACWVRVLLSLKLSFCGFIMNFADPGYAHIQYFSHPVSFTNAFASSCLLKELEHVKPERYTR